MIALRPFQKQTLEFLKLQSPEPSHVLCVAPTGSGKSLIYETAAQSASLRVLLITPLVALAHQQLQSLRAKNISAHFGRNRAQEILGRKRSGVWILSPESLHLHSARQKHPPSSFSVQKPSPVDWWKPEMLVVDECHCIWEWGQEFRPAFGVLPELAHQPCIRKSLWLTATLPLREKEDLKQRLPRPFFSAGRFGLPPRLMIQVMKTPYLQRLSAVLRFIETQTGAGIIFVPTREASMKLARFFLAAGKKTAFYHAGLFQEERRNIENQIREGKLDVIFSTSAFGMGMNYTTLRYVILWQAPSNLLSLVQALGRASRNLDQSSTALILWSEEDFRLQEWITPASPSQAERTLEVASFLQSSLCRRKNLEGFFEHSLSLPDFCGLCDNCLTSASIIFRDLV
ncbi:MAG: DEAD/DEAH box helicase [Bdellovibrionia bacterium]